MKEPIAKMVEKYRALTIYIPVQIKKDFLFLGDKNYGGWSVCPGKNDIVYSLGVGDNISFDLAMIERFGSEVFAFDPTHYVPEKFKSGINGFHFYPIGVSDKDGIEKFVRDSSERNGDGEYKPMKRIKSIMEMLGHDHIDVLKVDIEGSEYRVLNDMLDCGIYPKQILVEFHHRFMGRMNTLRMIRRLNKAGYKAFYVSKNKEESCFIR